MTLPMPRKNILQHCNIFKLPQPGYSPASLCECPLRKKLPYMGFKMASNLSFEHKVSLVTHETKPAQEKINVDKRRNQLAEGDANAPNLDQRERRIGSRRCFQKNG